MASVLKHFAVAAFVVALQGVAASDSFENSMWGYPSLGSDGLYIHYVCYSTEHFLRSAHCSYVKEYAWDDGYGCCVHVDEWTNQWQRITCPVDGKMCIDGGRFVKGAHTNYFPSDLDWLPESNTVQSNNFTTKPMIHSETHTYRKLGHGSIILIVISAVIGGSLLLTGLLCCCCKSYRNRNRRGSDVSSLLDYQPRMRPVTRRRPNSRISVLFVWLLRFQRKNPSNEESIKENVEEPPAYSDVVNDGSFSAP